MSGLPWRFSQKSPNVIGIDCGGEIGWVRLKADPTVKRCLPCQILVLPLSSWLEVAEKKKRRGRLHLGHP